MSAWHTYNILRTVCVGFGWLLVREDGWKGLIVRAWFLTEEQHVCAWEGEGWQLSLSLADVLASCHCKRQIASQLRNACKIIIGGKAGGGTCLHVISGT